MEGRQSRDEMLAEDSRCRALVCERMNGMSGVHCPQPEGSIYAFPDISGTGKTSEQLADEILEQCHVVVESGSFYGPNGEGFLRICFGSEPYERLEEALDRMAVYFNA